MTHRAQSATPVNKEAIRILVQDHGYKTASEISGYTEENLRQMAHRGEWFKSRPPNPNNPTLSQRVTNLAESHADTLQGHRERSLTHLAKYAEDAGRNLAESNGDLRAAKAFQSVAAGRANLFPEDQPRTAIQVNVLSFAAIRDTEASDA